MKKLPAFAIALAAAALTGTAVAGGPKTHTMDVSLPDGSVAHIDYVGDVAPRVTVAPPRAAGPDEQWAMPFPSFAGFDRMMERMLRQNQEMIQRAKDMSRQGFATAPFVAAYGNLPAGRTSTTVVSISNNGVSCTRTTEIVSQGPGKPPKVTSNVSGQCGSSPDGSNGPRHPA